MSRFKNNRKIRKIKALKKKRQYLKDKAEIEELKRQSRLNRARARANKEPWTYTKYLTAVIVAAWFIAFMFCVVYWIFSDKWNSEIMSTVNVIAVPTILSYAVKSGFEYKTRVDVQSDGVSITGSTQDY